MTEVPPAAPAGQAGPISQLLQKLTGLAQSFTTKMIGIGALSVLIIFVIQLAREPDVVLVPLTLPPKLAESGLSGRELTEQLLERVSELREGARPTASDPGWGIESKITYPDIEVGGVKWSFQTISDLLDGFGHRTKRVRLELSTHPAALTPSPQNWIVTAAVTGGRAHQVQLPLDTPYTALRNIAVVVLEDVEPAVAIRMHRFAKRCDDARRLAVRELNRARALRQRSIAFNTLGFVAECAFDQTGPNNDEAKAFYRQSIAIDSMNAVAHANLARILADEPDSADASNARFSRAIALEPKLAATYEAWGTALLMRGEMNGAIEKLQRAIALDPSSPSAQINLGSAYLSRGAPGDTTLAIENWAPAMLQAPDAFALERYAKLLMTRQRWVAAADAYRRALAIDPKELEWKYRLAVALDSGARKYEAQNLFVALAKESPDTSRFCAAAKRHIPEIERCGNPIRYRMQEGSTRAVGDR